MIKIISKYFPIMITCSATGYLLIYAIVYLRLYIAGSDTDFIIGNLLVAWVYGGIGLTTLSVMAVFFKNELSTHKDIPITGVVGLSVLIISSVTWIICLVIIVTLPVLLNSTHGSSDKFHELLYFAITFILSLILQIWIYSRLTFKIIRS